MQSKERIIGIDIGGTNFRIGAVDKEGNITMFRKIPVGNVFQSDQPLKDLCEYLKAYIQELSEELLEVAAISIGFPATLDRERQRVLQAPNISFMENLPVVKTLTDSLKIPVFIERDVTMALCYDKRKFKLPKCEVISGFYIGTGIGNAIFINGYPLAGKNGSAGELGHIPVDGSDIVCGCGNVGCIESLAGGLYLAKLQKTNYPETPIGNLFTEHGKEALLTQYIDRVAMAIATEINILNPDYNLVGGGVPSMPDFPQDLLAERIHFHTRKPYPAEDLNIIFTGDRPEKCVIGAAYYAFDKL